MERIMLKSKVHNAVTTQSNLDYDGSLTLDETLMKAADMLPNEQVQIYNLSNGERFSTYLIKGAKDSGIVGVNGAAAHLAKEGDRLIIVTYVTMNDEEADFYRPKLVFVDENNRIKDIR
jgi:aspartate 1-decarboxylase